MSNFYITTAELADRMLMQVEQVHQIQYRPEFASIRPEKAYASKPCLFNQRQALLMLLAGDMIRWGVKAPHAGRVVTRIAETLLFDPDAAALHVQFHRNGASFIFTSDEAPDAASAAGPAQFRLTFDLSAYRARLDTAMRGEGAEAPAQLQIAQA